LGKWNSELGFLTALGLWQMRAQTLALYTVVLDFGILALFLNHSTQNMNAVENWCKIWHFLND